MRWISCAIGLHRWGSRQDDFPLVPSEDDCARVFCGDGAWPNYPYQHCECCEARRDLPKTYVPTRGTP